MKSENLKSKKFNPATRRKARHFIVQALYQWQMAGHDIGVIEHQFLTQTDMDKQVDLTYFRELLRAILSDVEKVDAKMEGFLDRKLTELDPIEQAILRLGTYELTQRLDIPYKVAVNEALELAKLFGSPDSHKYVNGVLDKVAKQFRHVETAK
ncbi:MAG: transcription antitermination factor NusB [Gammaproteobacteria bacterium]